MINTWQDLTALTQNEEILVERVRLVKKDIVIEGNFELPPVAKITMEDQVFIAAFVKTHGSIKQMELIFGVSYPTIKNRLNKIGEKFDFVKIDRLPEPSEDESKQTTEVLDLLNIGSISVDEAIERLKK
jgi:hypothetical protein